MDEATKIEAKAGKPVLQVLAASALRSMLLSAGEIHAGRTGVGFHFQWGTSGAIHARMRAGDRFDLVSSARDGLVALAADGLVADHLADIGLSKLAMGVRAGESAPDISSADAFQSVLLAARSISRGDPAGGGTAGNHLVKVFAQLGVTEAVAAKSILRAGGFAVMKEVVEGRADFGLTQSTEIPAVAGAAIGAYLPDAVQLTTIYCMAPGPAAPAEALEFLRFLTDTEGKALAAAAGFAAA